MIQFNNKYFFVALLFFATTFYGNAQEKDDLWSKSSVYDKISDTKTARRTVPNKFKVYNLNLETLKNKLLNSPKRKGKLKQSNTVVSFPNQDGKLERYKVFEASIMEESLQKKHPNIRSYVGKGIDNPNAVIRFSVTPLGLHAMSIQREGSTLFIDPYTQNKESYIIYLKSSLPSIKSFECKFDEINEVQSNKTLTTNERSETADDGNLRTFKLAVATTGEYSQFHISDQGLSSTATDAQKKAAVLAAINVTMTRVNGIFERDVALTMKLVANNTDIIFLDSATDGFTNNDDSELINESQTIIDSKIGFSNYDIGHTFSTGGGGRAELRSPCTSGKARGITGSGNPKGDAYDIDFVAHEMGHQFGAHHTFNSNAGGCGGGNRADAFAVEPGSGTTIMGYAGLCTPENVQGQSDAYFHLVSIKEIWANISEGNSTCGAISVIGNNAPIVDDIPNYTIPVSTPFVLDANASDIDGDNLTYTWEQLDTEIVPYPLVSTATGGPAFRSFSPSNSSERFFPSLSTILSGQLSNQWEVLPSVARTMKFGVNIRDNNTNGGQTASKETIITVSANAGPFKITSQATAETWNAGTAQTITWDVANTNAAPVNCSFVNILLSTDGGQTFPIALASNTPNDGTHEVVVPNNTTTEARIKIESVGNIFFTINTTNINIQASEFIMNFTENIKKICAPNSVTYNFIYNTFLGFNETTTFSATGNPTGSTVTFNPTTATSDGTAVQMIVTGIDASMVGSHNISVTGTSTTVIKNTVVELSVYSNALNAPTLSSPEDNATSVLKPYMLQWGSEVNAEQYEVQIASDTGFTTIIESGVVNTNSFTPTLLQLNTNYFWRVKSINICGESTYSEVFDFTTANEICDSYSSIETPLNIPDNDSKGVVTDINITENKMITDVNVTVNITHPWLEDLTLTLFSPSGKSVLLSTTNGGDESNYTNTIFDDSAETEINFGVPPFTGAFQPQGDLSIFNNEESYGIWKLKVSDAGIEDIGKIQSWSIEICGVPVISNDNDKDGVDNAVDQCPNSLLGSSVDSVGCSSFSLPSNNFLVETTSETCESKDNGIITITANAAHNYTAIINQTKYNFTSALTVENLLPGVYDFCIKVEGEDYEQCYTLEINEGAAISGKITTQSQSSKAIIEVVQGTAPYKVEINGVTALETHSANFNIDVKHGDLVEVKTAISCEGVLSKRIEMFDTITAFPNPTTNDFEIALPFTTKQEVVVELYTIYSQLISIKSYPIVNGKVALSLNNKPIGVYIAKVHLDTTVSLKVIKE